MKKPAAKIVGREDRTTQPGRSCAHDARKMTASFKREAPGSRVVAQLIPARPGGFLVRRVKRLAPLANKTSGLWRREVGHEPTDERSMPCLWSGHTPFT